MSTDDRPRRFCLTSTDIESYSSFDNDRQVTAQKQLHEILSRAARSAGVERERWTTQSTGDGELALVPGDVWEAVLVNDFVRELDNELARYNRDRVREAWLRLRVAFHHGLAVIGENGFPGGDVVHVSRLVDADEVRDALREHRRANLVVVVSDRLYQDIVTQRYRGLRPEEFTRIVVDRPAKGFTAVAWVWLPGGRGDGPPPTAGEAPPIPESVSEGVTGGRAPASGPANIALSYGSGDIAQRDKIVYNGLSARRPEPRHGQR